jgi:hypothetical protein
MKMRFEIFYSMPWNNLALIFLALLSLGGCPMKPSMVDEVLFLPKPAQFKSTNINSIIQKHIPLGTPKGAAIEKLKSEVFVIKETKARLADCPNCDEIVLRAGFINKPWLFFIYYNVEISLYLGFEADRVVYASGEYMTTPY